MIPVGHDGIFEAALRLLTTYGENTRIRGRMVLLYLGLRRMRTGVASLGDTRSTPASEIEGYLDQLYTKTNRPEPLTVLTSPFGRSTSRHAPWSTRTSEVAPGNRHPTNTWRNNLNVQKGIGCPADPDTIRSLLSSPDLRLNCPEMRTNDSGGHQCGINGTNYRGDQQSIWLRMASAGYQVVDLDQPAVYDSYLAPRGLRIPIFALIPVLYHAAPLGIYPSRQIVGVPEFCEDFDLRIDDAIQMFECDPDTPENGEIIIMASSEGTSATPITRAAPRVEPQPLPDEPEERPLNTGVGAEIAVARNLQEFSWLVSYTGNESGLGYDLLAHRARNTLRVEVKSSVSVCTPILTEEEWRAAQEYGENFVLAVVDFYGSIGQRISYLQNPASNVVPSARQVTTYRVSHLDISTLGVGVESLEFS